MRRKVSDLIRILNQTVNAMQAGGPGATYTATTAPPTLGSYAAGTVVLNSSPTELGTAPDTYVVYGWICTASGSPGTWEAMNVPTAVFGSGKVDATRTISTTAPLSGGGDLSANRTLSISDFTSSTSGTVPASGGGTTNFLRADGTWNAPSGGGGGSGISGEATVTVPGGFEHLETIAAVGVTSSMKVFLSVAPHLDTDENDPEMLDIEVMSGTPSTDAIAVRLTFGERTSGPIKLNYLAA